MLLRIWNFDTLWKLFDKTENIVCFFASAFLQSLDKSFSQLNIISHYLTTFTAWKKHFSNQSFKYDRLNNNNNKLANQIITLCEIFWKKSHQITDLCTESLRKSYLILPQGWTENWNLHDFISRKLSRDICRVSNDFNWNFWISHYFLICA